MDTDWQSYWESVPFIYRFSAEVFHSNKLQSKLFAFKVNDEEKPHIAKLCSFLAPGWTTDREHINVIVDARKSYLPQSRLLPGKSLINVDLELIFCLLSQQGSTLKRKICSSRTKFFLLKAEFIAESYHMQRNKQEFM